MCSFHDSFCALQAAQMDRYRELRALLRLLTHVTQRDLVDFGTAEGEAAVDIAQVSSAAHFSIGLLCCMAGLHLIWTHLLLPATYTAAGPMLHRFVHV